jgi:hypothetical protein
MSFESTQKTLCSKKNLLTSCSIVQPVNDSITRTMADRPHPRSQSATYGHNTRIGFQSTVLSTLLVSPSGSWSHQWLAQAGPCPACLRDSVIGPDSPRDDRARSDERRELRVRTQAARPPPLPWHGGFGLSQRKDVLRSGPEGSSTGNDADTALRSLLVSDPPPDMRFCSLFDLANVIPLNWRLKVPRVLMTFNCQ